MKGSFLAGKPRPLGWEFQLALFIRSTHRVRGNLALGSLFFRTPDSRNPKPEARLPVACGLWPHWSLVTAAKQPGLWLAALLPASRTLNP